MSKLKSIFTSWRVILFVAIIILSIFAINPRLGATGVEIKSIEKNSSADINGVQIKEILETVNDNEIKTIDDYNSAISNIKPGDIIKIKTDKNSYSFLAGGYENITSVGLEVSVVPSSNIKKGLDLVGGVRVLLMSEEELTTQQMSDILTITKKRLNVYGLADIVVREVSDLEGNTYILVEIAGATKEEVVDLLEKQGKFEAKIKNETVFLGGTDIKHVERSAQGGAGVRDCNEFNDNWQCTFQFPVTVSPESAKKHADITSNLTVELIEGRQYLSEKLDLYLDDELVDSLYISADLQGQESTSFVIQGSGIGRNKDEAIINAVESMKKLQIVLITGSMPVKLNIAKMDLVSPALGQEFFNYAMIALVIAIAAVGTVVWIRYRKLKIAVPIVLTSLSEILIILGVAALIQWNLDLAAIAAILAAIGTGVDHQIIITDEILSGEKHESYNWSEKMKRAFFIIMAAYFTIVVAMLPLWAMGAGLLKGFAIITIIGVSIGVFITRPAYAKIIENLLKS